MKVKKKILILILVGLLVFSWAAARETEEEYPFEGPTTTTMTLEDYIGYVYQFLVIISGLIAFGVLLFGGFKYLTAGGNTEALKSARNYMLGAVTGLVLVLGSYLILKIINPNIFKPPKTIDPSRGICLYSKSNAEGQRYCYADSQKSMPSSFEATSLKFFGKLGEINFVYVFSEPNWEGESQAFPGPKEEGDPRIMPTSIRPLTFSPKSFFIEWNRSGIYLYNNPLLEPDFPNQPYQFYQSQVPDVGDYKGKVSSIFLKSKPYSYKTEECKPEIGYAAILHSKTYYRGECSIALGQPFTRLIMNDNYCGPRTTILTEEESEYYIHPIGTSTRSVTPFNYSFTTNEKGKVAFYEREDFQGDHFSIEAEEIGKFWSTTTLTYPISTSTSNFEVKKGDLPTDDAELDKIHSYETEGKFMVVLTQGKDLESRCQASDRSNPELSDDYVTGEVPSEDPGVKWEDNRIHSIAIIPLKEILKKY